MGKRKLIMGVIVGAMAGGLATLVDPEARAYTKNKFSEAKATSSNLLKNPSQTISDIRSTFDRVNDAVSGNLQKAINTLSDVEDSLEKVTGKQDRIED